MCPGSSGVEQWTENPRVGGSNPPPGTTEIIKILVKSDAKEKYVKVGIKNEILVNWVRTFSKNLAHYPTLDRPQARISASWNEVIRQFYEDGKPSNIFSFFG